MTGPMPRTIEFSERDVTVIANLALIASMMDGSKGKKPLGPIAPQVLSYLDTKRVLAKAVKQLQRREQIKAEKKARIRAKEKAQQEKAQ